MKKFRLIILSFLVAILTLAATIDTSSALYTSLFTLSNQDADATNTLAFFPISGQSLSDNGFVSSDTLDSVVAENTTTSIPSQPPSLQQAMESAQADDGGAFTDETTESNNSTADDMTLLPATVAANDAYYFGGDWPFRILTVNVSQVGSGDWSGTWEYWNGSAWEGFSNVDDRTNGFKSGGIRTVSWDIPTNWTTTSVNSVTSYYARFIVDSVTTTVTQPLGEQSWWETGYWITYVSSIDQNEQVQYTTYFGGTDFVENHQFFPGSDGYITSDHASIELGSGSWAITIEGYFNTDSTTGDYLLKTGAIQLENNASESIRLSITDGVDVNTATVTSVPSGFYSIVISSDQVNVTLTVPGIGSDSTTSLSIADTANDWTWGDGDTILYFNSIEISFPTVFQDYLYSGQMNLGATYDDAEVQGYMGISDIGVVTLAAAIDIRGYAFHSGDLWGVDSGGTLYQINESTGATISSCSIPSVSSVVGLASDSSNLWVLDGGVNDEFKSINTSCSILTGPFSVSTETLVPEGITYDGTNIWIVGRADGGGNNAELISYNTSGTNLSEQDMTTMFSVDHQPLGITWDGTFFWITSFDITGGTPALSDSNLLWRTTDGTDEIPGPELYGGATAEGINPGVFGIGYDSSTDTFYIGTDSSADKFQYEDAIITATSTQLTSSHIRQTIQGAGTIGASYPVVGWTISNDVEGSDRVQTLQTTNVNAGTYGIKLDHRNFAGGSSTAEQIISSGVSPGQVWSFGSYAVANGEDTELTIIWEQADGTDISTVTDSTVVANQLAIENQTAPALTGRFTIHLVSDCTGVCTGSDTAYFDTVQAIQNTAVESWPPTSTNYISNPSFELLYEPTEQWESDAISLSTVTDVFSSIFIWGETTPDDSSLLVETSIDGGSNWETATNGSTIPGIDSGDDLTGVSLLVRVTFNASSDQQDTAQFDSMSIQVIDSSGYALDYSPQEFIGLTLTDESPNTNDATTSFPIPTGYTTSVGPLVPTGNVAVVTGGGESPEVIGDISPGDEIIDPSGITLPADFPLGDLFQSFSDLADIPVIVPVVWASLIFMTYIGLITYATTSSVAASTLMMIIAVLGVTGSIAGILPIWVLIFFAFGALGMLIYTRLGSVGI